MSSVEPRRPPADHDTPNTGRAVLKERTPVRPLVRVDFPRRHFYFAVGLLLAGEALIKVVL